MSQGNVEIVRKALNAVRAHDRREVEELVEDDAEWHNTAVFPGERTWRGPAGIMEFWGNLIEDFEEVGLEIEDSLESGDRVVVGIHSWGRGRGSGAPVDVRWAALVSVRRGRIARVEVHGSYAKALEAAGLSK